MRRRDVIVGLGAAAFWPFMARAQSSLPVIGFLGTGSRSAIDASVHGFLAGLKGAGFEDGRNVTVEYRLAESQYDRLPGLAAELVRRPVDVLVAAQGNVSAFAARNATSTIPIVFITSDDPVATGLVASLSRPGGNLTGVSRLGTQLGAKNLELLQEVLPAITSIGLLSNPTRPTADAQIKAVQAAAGALGKIDGVFNILRQEIVALAAHHAIPAAYSVRDFISAGGLMGYGDDPADSYKVGGKLVARILAGAKPADLPVEQAAKLELVINLKTAKALGLTIPITLLGRADEVIE